MGQGTDVAIICHYSSVCYEYFASEALSGFSPFQLVFLRDPSDLTKSLIPQDGHNTG